MDDGTIFLIVLARLTHNNLESNFYACFMLIEKSPGYESRRLFLSKVRAEQDSQILQKLPRRQYVDATDESRFLVFLTVDEVLPLLKPRR